MKSGTIKVADHDGVYVIKLEGDVRLTLCLSFDSFIEEMLSESSFCSVVFDLTDAQAIDSTTLGLMAKISIKGRSQHHDNPVVITSNPNITKLLVSMGFDDIFHLVNKDYHLREITNGRYQSNKELLSVDSGQEIEVQDRVVEAHRFLMQMNKTNRDTFKELVETLESC